MDDEIKKKLDELREEFHAEMEAQREEIDRKIAEIWKRYEAGEAQLEELVEAIRSYTGQRSKSLKETERALNQLRDIGKKKGKGSDQ